MLGDIIGSAILGLIGKNSKLIGSESRVAEVAGIAEYV